MNVKCNTAKGSCLVKPFKLEAHDISMYVSAWLGLKMHNISHNVEAIAPC